MMHILVTFEYIKLTLYAIACKAATSKVLAALTELLLYLNQILWYECLSIWKSIPKWLILILYLSCMVHAALTEHFQLWRVENPSFENGGLSDQHWSFFCKKWWLKNGGLSDLILHFFFAKSGALIILGSSLDDAFTRNLWIHQTNLICNSL